MTEHSKIDSKNAQKASLFERADAAFGLDGLGPAAVPKNLPGAKRAPRASRPNEAGTKASAEEKVADAPNRGVVVATPKRPVRFSGPKMEINRDLLRQEGIIVPEDPVTGLLEEFRIVKRDLLADARASDDPTARRILVCSPHSGEGKTYCATNLAIALAAERDIQVVLVDADVLKPTVTQRMGVESDRGLMDALADETILPETLVSETDIDGLYIMPAGTSSARDAEYLTSARTGEVLDRLTHDAPNRFFIFDTPPALAASPAAELAAYVGQALLVVRADETSRAALEDARQLLSACPEIKLLLNAAQFSPSGRRFGTYGPRET